MKVSFDHKTKRFIVDCPFMEVNVIREFPSRRFDPKDKKWRVPLVKQNVAHLKDLIGLNPNRVILDEHAKQAIQDFEALTAAPKITEFPYHVYDFRRSKTGYVPMKHHPRMLDAAWSLRKCAWFAKMGTGKTFGAIHIAFARWQAGQIDKFVIICPSTLRKTWQKELAKYATGDYDFRIHETKAGWLNSFYNDPDPKRLKILAVSIEGLGVSEALYDSVCGIYVGGRVFTAVDESSRIKNPKAKRTDRAIQLGAVSDYALIMNGTPISVGIKDLWAQYEFLDPNIIGCGDDWTFKCRYLVMGGYENKKVVAYKNTDELMNLIMPYTVEVTKEVLDLPPKIPKSIYIEPTPEQKKLFKLIIKGSVGDPNEPFIKAQNTLEKRLRLRQVIGGWLPRGHVRERIVDGLPTNTVETICEPLASNPKMDTMMDIIEDNFEGSKFVIWSPFVPEIEEIVKRLEDKYGVDSVVKYYGAVSDEDRSRAEDRYCTDKNTRFFIGNPSAAGLGLTLISGENDVMIYYSSTDNFIDRQQSEDRCHRIGQKNSVVIMDLIMESSVDVLIEASTQQKQDIETFIFDRLKRGAKLDDLLMGVDTLAEV